MNEFEVDSYEDWKDKSNKKLEESNAPYKVVNRVLYNFLIFFVIVFLLVLILGITYGVYLFKEGKLTPIINNNIPINNTIIDQQKTENSYEFNPITYNNFNLTIDTDKLIYELNQTLSKLNCSI